MTARIFRPPVNLIPNTFQSHAVTGGERSGRQCTGRRRICSWRSGPRAEAWDSILEVADERQAADSGDDLRLLQDFLQGLGELERALMVLYLDGPHLDRRGAGHLGYKRRNQNQPDQAETPATKGGMTMELENLKRIWEEQGRKLEATIRLNADLVRESVLGRAAGALTRLRRLLLVELLLDLGVVVWLGSFLADHVAEVRFLVPALALGLGTIALAIACIQQLVAISSVDYGAPVLEIQKRLVALRVQRVRVAKLTLLAAPLAWTPLLIVALKGLADVDAYAVFSGAWLAANLVMGVAVVPLAVWLSRRYASRLGRSPIVQRLAHDLAGYNLNAAMGFLGSLRRFEEEPV